MRSSLRRIGILILIILLLPLLVFSIFEIGNLMRNESVIWEIYRNQLDAILYSINQYSDDVVSNYAFRVENALNQNNTGDSKIRDLLNENPSVLNILRFDNKASLLSSLAPLNFMHPTPDEISKLLVKNDTLIQRLHTYYEAGYRKIETLGNPYNNLQLVAFVIRVKEEKNTALMIIDPESFISKILDPKIQQIARKKFYIAAYRNKEEEPFYSSDKNFSAGPITEKRPFWLLQNYRMGIELKEATIHDLARQRVQRNLILIGLMDLILLLGAWIIFRNIKKQVELSQLKSDFVSSVSHEIRTPLALISMYIETLEMGRVKTAEKIQEYYQVILGETARLSGIVNRILNFSQIENNKRKFVSQPVDLNEVAERCALTFQFSLEQKGFTYAFEPAPDLPAIAGDFEAISDAFVNLIDNAIKYSADNKNISVRTGTSGDYAYLEVEDQGIGISQKNQKLIFDKFFRVTEKDLANKVKGSGLGLSIVKHIINAHKGRIIVKSNPGTGSLFRLLFPLK